MKAQEVIHPDKLRGGYYTPSRVVDFCIDRVLSLFGGMPSSWLEPSAGDGAFLRGLGRSRSSCRNQETAVCAVELIDEEATKAESVLAEYGLAGQVHRGSFFDWCHRDQSLFDAVVGNPPFVRYQFVPEADRFASEALMSDLEIHLRGVANLWIPFATLALSRVRAGGAFALVLPSELACTLSGGQFREYLIQHCRDICIDVFERGTFSDILQDVVVVSGRRAAKIANSRAVRFIEHTKTGLSKWSHKVPANQDSWTQYLLSGNELDAVRHAGALQDIYQLGDIAKFEVAIVTGANSFFTINDDILSEFGLGDWALPLLPKTSDALGIVYTSEDHDNSIRRGSRTWLLDFSADRPKPNGQGRVSEYLANGASQGLPQRYKCRIRDPWYRVPHIRRGEMMLTKRAHHFHRVLLNQAGVYTTDTIYRGVTRGEGDGRAHDIACLFQSTLTLLSSELEGRTYGGGVLELVPSEISRLRVPLVSTGGLIDTLDALSRSTNGQRDSSSTVVDVVDEYLCANVAGYVDIIDELRSARQRLMSRRQRT